MFLGLVQIGALFKNKIVLNKSKMEIFHLVKQIPTKFTLMEFSETQRFIRSCDHQLPIFFFRPATKCWLETKVAPIVAENTLLSHTFSPLSKLFFHLCFYDYIQNFMFCLFHTSKKLCFLIHWICTFYELFYLYTEFRREDCLNVSDSQN